jgi:hypothetical protein
MAAMWMRRGRSHRWTVLLTLTATTSFGGIPTGRGQRLWAAAWQESVTLRTAARVA